MTIRRSMLTVLAFVVALIVSTILVAVRNVPTEPIKADMAAITDRPPRPDQRLTDEPAMVVIGASIAEGYRTTSTAPWPRLLDELLRADGRNLQVVDASIGATRLLTDTPSGPSYRARLDAVLDEPNVHAVLITDLINDIQAVPHEYDPQIIEEALRDLVGAAHAHGVLVMATTITPYRGYHYTSDQQFTAEGEACRLAVNAAIRRGDLVDQVIDFDRALADVGHPGRLAPAYDSGDHLHPSDAGHQAMATEAAQAFSVAGRQYPLPPKLG